MQVNGSHGNVETRLLLRKWGKEGKEPRGPVGMGAPASLEGKPVNLASEVVEFSWARGSSLITSLHLLALGVVTCSLDLAILWHLAPVKKTAVMTSMHHIPSTPTP